MKRKSETVLIIGFFLLIGWAGMMAGCATAAQTPAPATQPATPPVVSEPAAPKPPAREPYKYHDSNTVATNPGGVGLSAKKLQLFKTALIEANVPKQNSALELRMQRHPDGMIDEHLRVGDSHAALVISTSPRVLVAAYTDELDCVVLLDFDPKLLEDYHLKEGDRLLTVNTYEWRPRAADVIFGPDSMYRYLNVYPLIAEFLSDDMEGIARTKNRIRDEEWARTQRLAKAYLARYGNAARDGNPYLSSLSAKIPSR